jgi:hypothetical protein
MTGPQHILIAPMGVGGVHHLIERAYREGSELQYVRELFKNALEAGATRIEFGPEWQAVEREGVYRLMVADNGKGMGPEELLKFLNTFGGGGKPIGDAHENFGVGAKTSLLPWNREGVVVISWVAGDPEGSMVWLRRDGKTGEYGARRFQTDTGSFEEVVRPLGDFSGVKPDWIHEHGTVVICLGNAGTEHTFLGENGDGDIKGLSAYLNKRIWTLPEHLSVSVQELRSQKREDWPRNYAEASSSSRPGGGAIDRRWNRRKIVGARHFLVTAAEKGRLGAHGVVGLKDETKIEWYLWKGDRPAVHSYAHMSGYIAALYGDELYDTQQHFSQFRSFGVTHKDVRSNLTLIAVPPKSGHGYYGVYPDTARNALKIRGTKHAGEPLPWPQWGQEFAEKMPIEIAEAVAKAGSADATGTIGDAKWKERLLDRFGRRWGTVRYILRATGLIKVFPAPAATGDGSSGGGTGGGTGSTGGHGPAPGGEGRPTVGVKKARPGAETATAVRRKGGVPDWRWSDESEIEPGVAGVWSPNDPRHENGVVLLNRQFAPFVELREYWKQLFADHFVDEVQKCIEEVYGEVMVAKIAHSEELRSDPRWGGARVESELRSPVALTMAALGLIAEDQVIAARLRARLGAKASFAAA